MAPNPVATNSASRSAGPSHWIRTIFWWAVTLATLVILDDLTFGPIFWLVSRWQGATAAMALAFVVYVTAQVFIVYQGTSEDPHRLAKFFLDRLDLNRRSKQVAAREHALRRQVVGGVAAVLITPLVGGVIPPMLLWRQGFPKREVRPLAIVCAIIYATEFSILHGWIPSTI